MTARLNHTIIWCRDRQRSPAFMTGILGLPPAEPFMHFMVVRLANDVSLDFMEKTGTIAPQHYAFLVNDAEFDAGFARIQALGLAYWADPARSRAGEINRHWGGRGVYFPGPDDHLLELITRPYGASEDL